MSRLLIAAAVSGCLLLLFPGSARAQGKWETNLAAAKQTAARLKRPLLVDFYAEWCGPCKQMEAETFRDATVRGLLSRVVCVKLDLDRNPPLAEKFEVQSIPRLLLLDPSGEGTPRMDLNGFRDAKEFADELRAALGLPADSGILPEGGQPELARVREALRQGQFQALKAAEPKVAAAGLNQLVTALGVFKEADLPPLVELLRKGGDDSISALLRGMDSRLLAVRAASQRTLLTLLRERKLTPSLQYDPWAPAAARRAQLKRWAQWWSARVARAR